MELNIRMVSVILAMLFFLNVNGQVKHHSGMLRDSVMLQTVEVTGKSKTQRLREGALAVNAIDIRSIVSSINSISSIIICWNKFFYNFTICNIIWYSNYFW